MNWVALIVFVLLFGFVTWLGFVAARWRKGDLDLLHEWGLGGRRFGTLITWFLVGGDLYTAYTFVAVPALAFGAGAIAFFAVPYTILVYPILFVVFPRLWHVSHKHGYITLADFVRGRFGNRWLALAVTITGIVATMPYIALQLVGLQVVIGALGIGGKGMMGDAPLIIAFLILAAFTYSSGLRAPAAIAIVKDTLIFVTVFAAIIVIPIELGGYSQIFAAVPALFLYVFPSWFAGVALAAIGIGALVPAAIMSIAAANLFTRNIYRELLLGLLALLGFMAIAAGVDKLPEYAGGFRQFKANFAVPALMLYAFPSWFAGVALAAIGIGALVPAAIMSIAAANLFTRNIYREFWRPDCTDLEESQMAKWVSLVVKAGALVFILALPPQYAIQLQLLGGIWIIQTLPPVILGLYTRWLDPWALLIGWAAGIGVGSAIAVKYSFTSIWPVVIAGFSFPGYTALYTLVLNLLIAVALTPLFKAMRGHAKDETVPADYHA